MKALLCYINPPGRGQLPIYVDQDGDVLCQPRPDVEPIPYSMSQEVVQAMREHHGWTFPKLAEYTGVTLGMAKHWANGTRPVSKPCRKLLWVVLTRAAQE